MINGGTKTFILSHVAITVVTRLKCRRMPPPNRVIKSVTHVFMIPYNNCKPEFPQGRLLIQELRFIGVFCSVKLTAGACVCACVNVCQHISAECVSKHRLCDQRSWQQHKDWKQFISVTRFDSSEVNYTKHIKLYCGSSEGWIKHGAKLGENNESVSYWKQMNAGQK